MGLRKFTPQAHDAVVTAAPAMSTAELEQALVSTEPELRRFAIWQCPCTEETLPLLLAHLAAERDEQVLEVLMTALARSQDERVVPVLLDLLDSEHTMLRNRALEVLGAYPQAVMAQIAQRFAKADSDERIFLVNLTADLRDTAVQAWLLQVLQAEGHVNVVAAALEVLVEIGDHQALPALAQVQQRFAAEPFIGFAVQLAQQRLGAA